MPSPFGNQLQKRINEQAEEITSVKDARHLNDHLKSIAQTVEFFFEEKPHDRYNGFTLCRVMQRVVIRGKVFAEVGDVVLYFTKFHEDTNILDPPVIFSNRELEMVSLAGIEYSISLKFNF